MPEFIVEEWITTYGPMEAEELCQALNLPAPTAIRVNTVKTTVEKCQRALEREGVECGRTRLSPDGLILQKRIGASASSIFARGWFEMQDEGSQVISYLLKPFSGARVVDACAGSGGKSLHIAALMGNRGVVYAIDSSSARLSRMQERIQRAGVSIIHPLIPTKNAREIEMLSGSSDAVLIDAPCSGTGTFRRNPAAKLILTEGIVYDYSEKQRRILNEYSTMVKPGGLLIYATCSLLRSENEDQVGQFLRDHPEFKLIPAGARLEPFGITLATSDAFLRLWPHRHGTDGFFAAAMLREAVI
jgi:16S rRNA (cytosine967-C5)-methyltransferase